MINSNSQSSTDGSRDDELPTDEKLNEASGGFFGPVSAIVGAGVVNGADQARLNASTKSNLARLREAQMLREHAQAKKDFHAQDAINVQKEDKLTSDLDGLDVTKLEDFMNSMNS